MMSFSAHAEKIRTAPTNGCAHRKNAQVSWPVKLAIVLCEYSYASCSKIIGNVKEN